MPQGYTSAAKLPSCARPGGWDTRPYVVLEKERAAIFPRGLFPSNTTDVLSAVRRHRRRSHHGLRVRGRRGHDLCRHRRRDVHRDRGLRLDLHHGRDPITTGRSGPRSVAPAPARGASRLKFGSSSAKSAPPSMVSAGAWAGSPPPSAPSHRPAEARRRPSWRAVP